MYIMVTITRIELHLKFKKFGSSCEMLQTGIRNKNCTKVATRLKAT